MGRGLLSFGRPRPDSKQNASLGFEIIETPFPLNFAKIFKKEGKRQSRQGLKKQRNASLSGVQNEGKAKDSRLSVDSGSKGRAEKERRRSSS